MAHVSSFRLSGVIAAVAWAIVSPPENLTRAQNKIIDPFPAPLGNVVCLSGLRFSGIWDPLKVHIFSWCLSGLRLSGIWAPVKVHIFSWCLFGL